MKRQILLGLFLLTVFCAASIFAQSNSPSGENLVTELIKLKNVPDIPNIVRVYNAKNETYYPERQISFRKLMDSVKIYLSPKGAIEIDARSRTLIITDTPSNIEFMKGVVVTFDYAEIYLATKDERLNVVYDFAGHLVNF
jgi:type II secretory pathway component GspD/PulD (secretin)